MTSGTSGLTCVSGAGMLALILKKKYAVILTDADRYELKQLIAAGTAHARKLTHARILLKADQSPGGPATVSRMRKWY